MSRRFLPVLIAGLASLPALFLPAGQAAFAQQINLSNTRGIDFGRFVAGTGGTITVSPSGLRTSTGGVILLNSPSAGQASFVVNTPTNGGGGKAVIISLPSNGSSQLASGSNSMALSTFVSSPAMLGNIGSAGATLSVGATLTVAANQSPGNYSGSIPVIVNFQ